MGILGDFFEPPYFCQPIVVSNLGTVFQQFVKLTSTMEAVTPGLLAILSGTVFKKKCEILLKRHYDSLHPPYSLALLSLETSVIYCSHINSLCGMPLSRAFSHGDGPCMEGDGARRGAKIRRRNKRQNDSTLKLDAYLLRRASIILSFWHSPYGSRAWKVSEILIDYSV